MTADHPKPRFEGLKLVSGMSTVIVAAVKLRLLLIAVLDTLSTRATQSTLW